MNSYRTPKLIVNTGSRLPLILSVSVDLNFAEVARGVRIGGDRSNKEERVALQKVWDAGEGVRAAPPSVLRVKLLCTRLNNPPNVEAVRALVSRSGRRPGEFVLRLAPANENAGAPAPIAVNADSAVLVPTGVKLSEGVGFRFTSLSASLVRVKLKRARFTRLGVINRRHSTVAKWLPVMPCSGQRGDGSEPRNGKTVLAPSLHVAHKNNSCR